MPLKCLLDGLGANAEVLDEAELEDGNKPEVYIPHSHGQRRVDYTPYTLKDYKERQEQEKYQEMGTLGPDLVRIQHAVSHG